MEEIDFSPSGAPILKASTVKQLLDLEPFPHVLIVIGENQKQLTSQEGEIISSKKLLRIQNTEELETAFNLSEEDFSSKYGTNKPARYCVLVVVDESQSQNQLQRALRHLRSNHDPKRIFGIREATGLNCILTAADPEEHRMLSRHGVAAALKLEVTTIVDIRRSQERELYGGIEGATHYSAAEDWPFLMNTNPPISPKSPVVFQCRSNRRAKWLATVARDDFGYEKTYVYREGSYGWRFSASVKAYPSFEVTDSPPEPESFEVETPDIEGRGMEELRSYSIIL